MTLHTMSDADRIAHLEAQIARMRAANQRKLTLKVSTKGAVSVYGMGRWPVTLYQSQWERLLDMADTIRDFIKDNADALANKDE
jgi:hypothetical protein